MEISTTAHADIQESYRIIEFKTKSASNCASSFFTTEKNWFKTISSEILVPDNCIVKRDGRSYFEFLKANETSEIAILIIISVTFVMSLLISITYRSTNPYISDWFRFITLYASATLLFVFILQLAPATPGFSRFVGFAVVIHNFAELYLLRIIWFGKRSSSFLGIGLVVLYVFLMLSFLAFLPMNALYLLALTQGATMDYLFCLTLPMVAHKLKAYPWNYCDWILASVGAFIHIASIQPLFLGFSLGNGQITGITTLGLFPTFFFYTYFAGRELGRLGFVGPSYSQLLTYFWSTTMLKKVAHVDTELSGGINPVHLAGAVELRERDIKTEITSAETGSMVVAAQSEIVQLATVDDFDARKEDLTRARELADLGVIKFFKLPTWQIVLPFVGAFLIALSNALIIWFTPCYIDMGCRS